MNEPAVNKYKEMVGEHLIKDTFYIKIRDLMVNCFMVVDFSDEKEIQALRQRGEFRNGKGYVDVSSEQVWIYSDSRPIKAHHYPYFWFNDNDVLRFSDPDEDVLKEALIVNIRNTSVKTLLDRINNGDLKPNERMNNMSRDGSATTIPIIHLKDDHLKKQVKAIIRKKMRSLSTLPQIGIKNTMGNMRSALLKETKMSTPYHETWCEVLGVDFIHFSFDNGNDPAYPFNEVIVYDSRTGMISYLPMSEMNKILSILKKYAVEDPILKAKIAANEDDSNEPAVEVIELDTDDENADIY